VPGLILAAVTPDNTPHGYNLSFAFPMLLFIIIGGVLYLLFSRPHRRVPARGVSLPARSAGLPSPAVPTQAVPTQAAPTQAAPTQAVASSAAVPGSDTAEQAQPGDSAGDAGDAE
jgi:hypothetical protein